MEDFEFKLGKFVTVDLRRPQHILERHGMVMSVDEIIALADKTKGIEGVHVFDRDLSEKKIIVIRGIAEIEGQKYGIVRTVWGGEVGSQ